MDTLGRLSGNQEDNIDKVTVFENVYSEIINFWLLYSLIKILKTY